eukprot:4793616-Pleurochrysis_carterae.AAC.1
MAAAVFRAVTLAFSQKGNTSMLSTLLECGAGSVDEANANSGAGALHLAAQAGEHRAVKWLLRRP